MQFYHVLEIVLKKLGIISSRAIRKTDLHALFKISELKYRYAKF